VRREAELMAKRIGSLVCAANADKRFLPTVAAIRELIFSHLSTWNIRLAYGKYLKAATTTKRTIRCTVGDLRRDAAMAQKIGFRDSKRLCEFAKVEVIEERYLHESELPTEKIECDEEATHYVFDCYGVTTLYHGEVDGKRSWTHQTEDFKYLGLPVTPPGHVAQSSKPLSRRRKSKA
jgi:hypothetical protein